MNFAAWVGAAAEEADGSAAPSSQSIEPGTIHGPLCLMQFLANPINE
jgi:hypothetical protein